MKLCEQPTSLCYFGTSEHAARVLSRLADSAFRPTLVITPPDRGRGRGRKVTPAPAAQVAIDLELPLHRTADVNSAESLAAIREAGCDIGLVCAFGQLLRNELLDQLELLNVHPSLLPRWRGAAPIERAIMAGDAETGVTIMRVTEGLDSGPVGLQERLAIGATETFGSLDARLGDLGGELAVKGLAGWSDGSVEFFAQPEEGVTYAEKIDRAERILDPARSAAELDRIVRALTPHIGAQLALAGDERLGVREARPSEEEEVAGVGELAASEDGAALLLGCDPGTLRIERVLPAGGREMASADYLRGRAVPILRSA